MCFSGLPFSAVTSAAQPLAPPPQHLTALHLCREITMCEWLLEEAAFETILCFNVCFCFFLIKS